MPDNADRRCTGRLHISRIRLMTGNFNLACGVHRRATGHADAPAVVCRDIALSYGELAARAGRLAACLATQCGDAHGAPPRVGILASRSAGACVAALGACWAGAAYVPFGLRQPEERLLDLFAQCRLSALITDDDGLKLLGGRLLAACPSLVIHAGDGAVASASGQRRIIELASLPAAALQEPAPMAAGDIAYIIFTSGSTGAPKGVMVSAGAFRHYLAAVNHTLGMTAADRVLGVSELSFDVSAHNMFATWEAGAALHVLPAAATINAVKFARSAGLTVWNSAPSLAAMLRQLKTLAPGSLPDLRVTAFGGEQLPASTVAAWRQAAPGSAIFNVYGPTEATVGCLAQQIAGPLPVMPGRDVIAIGTPFAGSEARIAGADGQPLADGEPGELLIAGEQLAAGYLDAPGLTAARFPVIEGKRWYRTGDLALRDQSGRFHCLGRIDNQVKILGHRIELDEIDGHLRHASGVDLVSAVAWPLVDGAAHGIVAFVGARAIEHEKVIDTLKARIPAYMMPRRVIAMQHLPLNAGGKVDRLALRRLLADEQL
jgi:amino acid adenylation domain-containing protein